MNYTAYNLTLQSNIQLKLPEAEEKSEPDITISLGEVPEPNDLCRTYDGVWYAHEENQMYLGWESLGKFLIRNGQEIIIAPSTKTPPSQALLSAPLLGTVMAVALHQKEMTTLHGSSVDIDGKGIIFLGEKGEGKSTFAGHFQKEGYTLISDDVCAVSSGTSGSSYISPSFPTIKLWPDAMEHLDYTPDKHERIHPKLEKRRVVLDSNFASAPTKLSSLIVLETGSITTLKRLKGHVALPALLPHIIINRFPEHQPANLKTSIYYQVSHLLQTVPMYRLTRPRNASLLPKLSEMIKNNSTSIHS